MRSVGTRAAALAAATAIAALAAGCGGGGSGNGSASSGSSGGGQAKGDYTVVLSNSYTGNAWRKTMVKNFEQAAKTAVSQGLIKHYQVLNTAQNTATQQIAQLQTQLLKKPDAILINSASPTALNGVIQKACAAGIKVVVFDSLASAPCAYKVAHNFVDYGKAEGEFIAQQLNGKGNVIEVRGVSGSEPDVEIHNGIHEALKDHPGIKIVATVHGEASQTTAQQAVQGVLRSLPKVDAVFTQGGGDSFGVIQAFKSAGKPVPPVVLGNAGNELAWWKQQVQKEPSYKTLSEGTMPSQSTIALGVAIDLLQGKAVPKQILDVPILTVTPDTLDAWASATPANAIASPVYSQQQADQLIQAAKDGQKLPDPPGPTH
jgi:ribose transport system substrate-binding protein